MPTHDHDPALVEAKAVKRSPPEPAALDPAAALHGAVGNRAVQRSLRVTAPHDPSEREADRVADSVMQPAPAEVARQDDLPEEEPEEAVASDRSGQPQPSAADVSIPTGPGRALDAGSRRFFEPRFGRDLSEVRVHTGDEAARAAKELSANAFTVGTDVYFGAGRHRPGTEAGDRLLAHELTHTVQQAPDKLPPSAPDEDRA